MRGLRIFKHNTTSKIFKFHFMKEKLTDEIRDIFAQTKSWLKLEVDYAKYTVAEKFTILMAMLIIGAICLLMGVVVLVLLALALSRVFMLFLCPALAYLCVAGIICVLILILFLARKPLLFNPISRFITRLFFGGKKS